MALPHHLHVPNKCPSFNISDNAIDIVKNLNSFIIKNFYFLMNITDNNINTYLRIIKNVIPYHIYTVLLHNPELIIDKLDMFILLLYFIQTHIHIKTTKYNNIIKTHNTNLFIIIKAYLYHCFSKDQIQLQQTQTPQAILSDSNQSQNNTSNSDIIQKKTQINKYGVGFLDPGISIGKEHNKKLSELIKELQNLISPIPSQNETTSVLKNLNDSILKLEISLYGMKEQEKKFNLKLELPSYITLPSTWFLTDLKGLQEKKPAYAKGAAELEAIIKEYQPQVTKSFDNNDPVVINSIKNTIDILCNITDIYDKHHELHNQTHINPVSGKFEKISSDLSIIDDNKITDAIKFLNNSIAMSSDIKDSFVKQLLEKLVLSSTDEQARICNNILKYGNVRFKLTDTHIINFKTQCSVNAEQQKKQSKKNNNLAHKFKPRLLTSKFGQKIP